MRAESSQGTGSSQHVDPLALPLLARIVAAHGGHVESVREPARGFGLKLRWPQFQSSVLAH